MTDASNKVLLVSVGGSPEPIIYTIEQHKPHKLIYFCSRDSRTQIKATIEPHLRHLIQDVEIITTPDEQSLLVSVQELVREIPRCLANMNCDFSTLVADFTGGTKSMAAAVVLALADRGCHYSYVGGIGRSKEGLGVVLSGREQMLYSDNPWDALGREPLKLFALHFNRCRFGSAADTARMAAARSERLKPLFSTLATLAEGYGKWDNFDHQGAINLLKGCRGIMKTLPFIEEGQGLTRIFAQQLAADIERAQQVKNDLVPWEG